jgi:hypothetical protein
MAYLDGWYVFSEWSEWNVPIGIPVTLQLVIGNRPVFNFSIDLNSVSMFGVCYINDDTNGHYWEISFEVLGLAFGYCKRRARS